MKRFENKVVLITGGGTGIGKAAAVAFIADGAKVVIVGRRQSVLVGTVNELGASAHFIVGDVSKSGESKAIVDEVIEKYGQLDVLVYNAGAATMSPLLETSDEEIELIYRVNVFAVLAFSREALPHLIKTKGSIINISSTVSNSVMPGLSVYASSKAAVNHLTKILAAECGPSGVRVNTVAPGFTTTDMSAEYLSDEQMLTTILAQTPMGRVGEPSDIAKAVLLLASDDAKWITGKIVQASGGFML